jgi:hypothetical protein
MKTERPRHFFPGPLHGFKMDAKLNVIKVPGMQWRRVVDGNRCFDCHCANLASVATDGNVDLEFDFTSRPNRAEPPLRLFLF